MKPLGKGHAKATEAEVLTVRFLHVDADLPAGTAPDDVETARAELLAKIKAAPLVPSLIINSGNGFGLFWELAEPVTVTAENREDIKARNIALADHLGGDDCENLDRVMRASARRHRHRSQGPGGLHPGGVRPRGRLQ